jgi:hypothetical protein
MTDYRNKATQREREEVLRNDRANTYAGRAQAEADEIQGRFSQREKATVIGIGAIEYPQLPENSWTNDPVPPEEPLGIDVNYVEAVGEKFEVDASLDGNVPAASAASPPTLMGFSPALPSSSNLAAVDAPLTVNPSVDVERPQPSPIAKRRRR